MIYTYSISEQVANSTVKSSSNIRILHQNMLPTYRQKLPWYTCSRTERRITNVTILVATNREGKISELNGSKQERGKSHPCGNTVRPSVYRCPFWRTVHRLQPLYVSHTRQWNLWHVFSYVMSRATALKGSLLQPISHSCFSKGSVLEDRFRRPWQHTDSSAHA
jgi:hypothetical protein